MLVKRVIPVETRDRLMGMEAPVELIPKIIILLETSTLDRRTRSLNKNRTNISVHHQRVMLEDMVVDMLVQSI
jgi:hypothetical protein